MSEIINKAALIKEVQAAQGKDWQFEVPETAEGETQVEAKAISAKVAGEVITTLLKAMVNPPITGEDLVIENFATFTTTHIKAGVFVGKDAEGNRKETPTPAFAKPVMRLTAAGKRLDSGLSNPNPKRRAFISAETGAKLAGSSESDLTGKDFTVVANYVIQNIIDGLAKQNVYNMVGILKLAGVFVKGCIRVIAGREYDVADKVSARFKASKKYRKYD